jgi:hypothetical protein
MIAAQNYPFCGDAICCGYPQRERAEGLGVHPGIASKLIDLIGGGLDQQGCAVRHRLPHCGLKHKRVRGADRVNAKWRTTEEGRAELLKNIHVRAPVDYCVRE